MGGASWVGPTLPQDPASTLTTRASPAGCAFHTPHSPAFKQGPDGRPEVLGPASPGDAHVQEADKIRVPWLRIPVCLCRTAQTPGSHTPRDSARPRSARCREWEHRVPAVLGRAGSSETPTPMMDMTLAPAHSRGPHTLAVGERRAGPLPYLPPARRAERLGARRLGAGASRRRQELLGASGRKWFDLWGSLLISISLPGETAVPLNSGKQARISSPALTPQVVQSQGGGALGEEQEGPSMRPQGLCPPRRVQLSFSGAVPCPLAPPTPS